MLMQHPDDLVRMGNEIGRKFQGDEPIHASPVDFRQIHQPARQHLFRNTLGHCRIKRNRDDRCFVAFSHERRSQSFGMRFRTPGNERNLDRRDDDSHGLEGPGLFLGR